MARDGKYKINYEQSPLIVDMHQKRRERFKWKKTPHPVLSKPRIAKHPPGVKASETPTRSIDDAQEPLRAVEPGVSIWWPSPTQFKHIEANWAFFLGFVLMCVTTGAAMAYQIADAVRGPWEEMGALIGVPLGAIIYFLALSFFVVRILRTFGGPITTLAQLGRFSTLSVGVRIGMAVGFVASFFMPGIFGISNSLAWSVFSTLGTMGLVGTIFGWTERNILGAGANQNTPSSREAVRLDDKRNIFDTAFYKETLPLASALLVALGATAIVIADRSSGFVIQDNQISIGDITIDRAFPLLLLQAAILAMTFRWTARLVSAWRHFFGFKELESLN